MSPQIREHRPVLWKYYARCRSRNHDIPSKLPHRPSTPFPGTERSQRNTDAEQARRPASRRRFRARTSVSGSSGGRLKRSTQPYTIHVDLTEERFNCGFCKSILRQDRPSHRFLGSGAVSCVPREVKRLLICISSWFASDAQRLHRVCLRSSSPIARYVSERLKKALVSSLIVVRYCQIPCLLKSDHMQVTAFTKFAGKNGLENGGQIRQQPLLFPAQCAGRL